MVNAVGLQNMGVRAFVAEKLPALRKYDTAIIANVFGHSIAEYLEVVGVLEDCRRSNGLRTQHLLPQCGTRRR